MPKIKLFLQKNCKIFEHWGLRSQTHLPLAIGGNSALDPKKAPIANFWLHAKPN